MRKAFAITGLLGCAVSLPFAGLADINIAMAALVLAFIAIGFFTSNVWAITQMLAGKHAAGTWTGVQNAAGKYWRRDRSDSDRLVDQLYRIVCIRVSACYGDDDCVRVFLWHSVATNPSG